MSQKITQDFLLEKMRKVFPNNTGIEILVWNGYTKPLTFKCDICGEIHTVSDARQMLNKKTYCKKNAKNNLKWDLQSFKDRIDKLHEEDINIIEYNGLSNPIKYYCPRCHALKMVNPARTLITKLSLCNTCYGIEKTIVKKQIDSLFEKNKNYSIIAWHGVNKKMLIHHNVCNNSFERYPTNVLSIFDTCPFCNNGGMKQKLDIEVIQKRIDNEFGIGQYQLLNYQGQLKKTNKIKCLNCNLIFNAQCSTFLTTRGCPKCQRYKSKGEQLVQRYLTANNIIFETQKRFKDCNNNLSSFDFCVYDSQKEMHLIEVNGRQHYFESEYFDNLALIQKRDQIKIDYCKNHNIDLIIIPYSRLTEKGIDYFLSKLKGSTTIPEGSRE